MFSILFLITMNKQQLIDKLYKQLSSQGVSYQKWELNEIVVISKF